MEPTSTQIDDPVHSSGPPRSDAADTQPPLRLLHFRRIFSQRSESFIYQPIVRMQRQRQQFADVDCRVLCLIRRLVAERPAENVDQLFRMNAGAGLRRAPWMASAFSFGIEQIDVPLWPMLRRLMLPKIQQAKPDVILAHFGPDGCLIAPLAQRLGIPLAVVFYGYDVSRLLHQSSRRWRREYAALFDSGTTLIAISQYIKQRLIDLGAPESSVAVIPPGVDMQQFHYSDPAARFDGNTVRCIHVGRLTEKKSPVHLVRAFTKARQLLDNKLNLELTIVGDGALWTATERAIEQCGAGQYVSMLGAKPHDEIVSLLHQHHIYLQHCMTAADGDTEGLGVTFIEASGCGLPIVTTRHNGIPDVVLDGRTGLLTPEGDVEAMARSIAELARDPQRWTTLGAAGRAHVLEHYEINNNINRLLNHLRTRIKTTP